jgi:hypothetical protein
MKLYDGEQEYVQCALRYSIASAVCTAGLLLLGESNGLGQSLVPAADAAAARPLLEPLYEPLTLKQKYKYSIQQMFSGPRLAAILVHTALDHAEVKPYAWGPDAPAFGVRAASLFGRSFVRATISSGIRGLDHEDPRYFYSHETNGWARTKYALSHTFEVRNDNGSMMPAYSRLVGDIGMPFLSQTWHPGGVNAPDALRSGGMAIGMSLGMTVAQEFWPDVKQKLLHRGPGAMGMVSPGVLIR